MKNISEIMRILFTYQTLLNNFKKWHKKIILWLSNLDKYLK